MQLIIGNEIKFNDKNMENTIKMYFFNPNDWGIHYTVMDTLKENALNSLKTHLKLKSDEEEKREKGLKFPSTVDLCEYNYWKDATINNLPNKFTIDEYSIGDVLEGEYA